MLKKQLRKINTSTNFTFLAMICMLLTLLTFPSLEENRSNEKLQINHAEYPEDEYVPIQRKEMQLSPGYKSLTNFGFTVQVNVNSNGQNLVGDAGNEPSIAISPVDPNKIVIGWRQFDTVNNNFRQAGYSYTSDGGQTWTFPGVIEPGIFRSDPVLDFDSQGIFYYNSLTSQGGNMWCDVFKSYDGGATWDMGTFAQGGDKQWMVIDKTGGVGEGNIYAYWTYAYSICSPGFFTRSIDRGSSYESCITIPDSPYWGTLSVAKNGDLYIGGVDGNGFVIAKSTTAKDSNQIVTWDFTTQVSLDGERNSGTGPNPGGLLGQTWIATDTTTDNVYLLSSVDRFSTSDPLDVMFSRSTDGGISWSSPVRINDDTTDSAWQWFGTMSVAPNGRIDVVWLDTRDNLGTYLSALYYSYSMDAGITWTQNQKLSADFDPHLGWPQQNKMGDYFHMVSNEAGAHLAWANTLNGEQDVYYSFIGEVDGIIAEEINTNYPGDFKLSQNFPNPFNSTTSISYQLPKSGIVSLKIYNMLGQEIKSLINEKQAQGTHQIEFEASNLASGVFYYRLQIDELVETKKFLLLK